MLNIIFTLDKTAYQVLETEQGKATVDYFKSLGAEWAGIIPEFREYNAQIGIQANAPSFEVIEIIKSALAQIDHPKVIGVWDKETGERIETGELGEIEYPFDSALYLNMMDDIVSYNEEGEEVSRERPTELKQVNKWAGQVDRDLSL